MKKLSSPAKPSGERRDSGRRKLLDTGVLPGQLPLPIPTYHAGRGAGARTTGQEDHAIHPVTTLLPPIPAAEYEALKDDIRENGLLEPIWLSADGKVIDGRHRYRACKELGVEPEFQETEYVGEELLGIVVALNLKRRHLDESQRAMVAAKLMPIYEKAAKERMSQGGEGGARVPPLERGKARDKAAETVGVSGRSVSDAKRVINEGDDQLREAVESGELAVSDAANTVHAQPEVEASQRRPGNPGYPKLTPLQKAFLRHAMASNGWTLQEFAGHLAVPLDTLNSVINGRRGIESGELRRWLSLVSPPPADQHAWNRAFNEQFSPWINRLRIGADSQSKERDAGPEAQGGARSAPPTTDAIPSVVAFHGLPCSGKARNPAALMRFFTALVPALAGRGGGTGRDSESSNDSTHGLDPDSYFDFTLNGAPARLVMRTGFNRSLYKFNHLWHYRRALLVTLPQFHDAVVAVLALGATRSHCAVHGYTRGPHKRGGNYSHGCWFEYKDQRCPSDHYRRIPKRRCGHCSLTDLEAWRCNGCKVLIDGPGCPDCDRLSADNPDLRLQVTGIGCQLGYLEALVSQLFSRFARPETVVRESPHIAVDLGIRATDAITFQHQRADGVGLFGVVEHHRNNDGDAAPGFYRGSKREVVSYGKLAEYAAQVAAGDPTARLPDHFLEPGAAYDLRLEFRPKGKSEPGAAADLSTMRKTWNTIAAAYLPRADPNDIITRSLLTDAREFGFTHHKPSIERVEKKFADVDSAKAGKRWDVVDLWTLREWLYGAKKKPTGNPEVLAAALFEELKRIKAPIDIGAAVEDALPDLEDQIRRALTPPSIDQYALPTEVATLGVELLERLSRPMVKGVDHWANRQTVIIGERRRIIDSRIVSDRYNVGDQLYVAWPAGHVQFQAFLLCGCDVSAPKCRPPLPKPVATWARTR